MWTDVDNLPGGPVEQRGSRVAAMVTMVVDLLYRSFNFDDLVTGGDRSLAFIGSTTERKVMSSR